MLMKAFCVLKRQFVLSLVLLSAAVPHTRGQARPGILSAPDTLIPLPPPVPPFQIDLPSASAAGAGGDAGIESEGPPSASTESGSSGSALPSSPDDLPDGSYQQTILGAVGLYGVNQTLQLQGYSSTQIADYAQVPGVVSYPNLTSQATLVSGINVTSFLTQDFALDLTSAERQLLSNYSYTYPKVVVRGIGISDGYRFPRKQGIDDGRYISAMGLTATNAAARAARWAAYGNILRPGVHKQNVFWNTIEDSLVGPSDTPLTCPPGYRRVPSDAAEKAQAGYHHYHCLQYAAIFDMESWLYLDGLHGIETVAIIFGTPPQFSDAACKGFEARPGSFIKTRCAVSRSHQLSFQDFVTFLSYGRQGRWSQAYAAANGRFTHFVLGNEVSSSAWYDLEAEVDITQRISAPDARHWVARYAQTLRMAHAAIQRNAGSLPAMLYVSLDRIWSVPDVCPGEQWTSWCPLGVQQFLTLLWETVGTDVDYSLALHPYGLPLATGDIKLTSPYAAYGFLTLQRVVDFQIDQMRRRGVSHPETRPQAMVAASEQHWNAEPPENMQAAKYVCTAHALAMGSANIVWATHLDFQEIRARQPTGIIQPSAGPYLNTSSVVTDPGAQAYAATDPAVWGVDSLNYCCRGFALGCPPAPVPPKSAAREQGPESARADWEEGSKAASSAVRPVARCHSSAVAAVYRCTANNFQVMSALNAGSSDASGLAVRKSISPSGPFELGRHIVKLTISNPFHSASCSGTITVQDREPLRMDTVRLCGGGTGGSLQVADLPMGYTLGYEKANGCPVQLSVSRLPACSPVTASSTDQARGFSCYPGSVTTTPQLAIAWQRLNQDYAASWNVSVASASPAAYRTSGSQAIHHTCTVYVAT